MYDRAPKKPRRSTRRLGSWLKIPRSKKLWRRGRSSPAKSLPQDRKSTRLNSSHGYISYAVFCLKKKKTCSLSPAAYKNIRASDRASHCPLLSFVSPLGLALPALHLLAVRRGTCQGRVHNRGRVR